MRKSPKRLVFFLLASLLIHLSLGIGLKLSPHSIKPEDQPDELEISFLDRGRDDQSRQIVEQDLQVNDDIPEESERLSKFNQRVVRETKASAIGAFKNTQERGSSGNQALGNDLVKLPETQNGPNPLPSKPALTLSQLTPQMKLPNHANPSQSESSGEPSQTDDYLPEVEKGLQTLLSSREFVYYAYYSRIKEKIRQYWLPTVTQKVKIIQRSGRQIASSQDRITQVVIVLNAQGDLLRVEIIGPSGVQDLDDAAVEAFRAAAPFPNPPKGMVEQDGHIRIRWDFVLEA